MNKFLKNNYAVYTIGLPNEALDQIYETCKEQYENCIAYLKSQDYEYFTSVKRYADVSTLDDNHPDLIQLLNDIKQGIVKCVLLYNANIISASLPDFHKLIELCDEYGVLFISVSQHFNTDNSKIDQY